MNISPFGNMHKVERTISRSADTGDIDMKGMLIGIASVLSGTLGLAYRAFYPGK